MQEGQDSLVLKAEECATMSLFIQAPGELQGMGEMQTGGRRGQIPHASPSCFRGGLTCHRRQQRPPPVISMGLQRCVMTVPQTGRILTAPELCSCPNLSPCRKMLQHPSRGSRALLPAPALVLAGIPGEAGETRAGFTAAPSHLAKYSPVLQAPAEIPERDERFAISLLR